MKLGTYEVSARHIISLVVSLLLPLFTPCLNTFKKGFVFLFIKNKSFVLYLFQSCQNFEKEKVIDKEKQTHYVIWYN